MENYLLSLKNIYRLVTVKDYPLYSMGIISEKRKKGLTLIKFWTQYLLFDWRNTLHGKQIWRTDGSKNRYHSELCNRKESFPFYEIYTGEILEILNENNVCRQIRIFEAFLLEKQYDHRVFLQKVTKYLELIREQDSGLPQEICEVMAERIRRSERNEAELPESFLAGWLLSCLTFYAISGKQVQCEAIERLRVSGRMEAENLWKYQERIDKKKDKVQFLTGKNSELFYSRVMTGSFFGREAEVFDLKEMLKVGGKYLVSGIGGVGKTELLRQLLGWCLEENQADYLAVVQYENDLKESFVRAFLNLTGTDVQQRFHEALHILCRYEGKKVVLFIDNVDTLPEQDPDLGVLKTLPCTIFLSTRQKSMEGFRTYPIAAPGKQASSLIFRENYGKVLSETERDCLENLLENRCYRHPLTLRSFGKAASARNWSVEQLSQQLEEQGIHLTWQGERVTFDLQNMYRQMYRISGLDETQRRLVRLFAVMPYRSLDDTFLHVFFGGCLEAGKTLREELLQLEQLGWLEKSRTGYVMHPVIAESVRTKAPVEAEFEAFWERARRCYYEGQYTGREDAQLTEWSGIIFSAITRIRGTISEKLLRLALDAGELQMKAHCADTFLQKSVRELEKRCADRTDELQLRLAALYMLNLEHAGADWNVEELLKRQQKQRTVSAEAYCRCALRYAQLLVIDGAYEQAEQLLRHMLQSGCSVHDKIEAARLLGSIRMMEMKTEDSTLYYVRGLLLADQTLTQEKMKISLIYGICMNACFLNRVTEAEQCLDRLEVYRGSRYWNMAAFHLPELKSRIALMKGEMESAIGYMERFKEQILLYWGNHHWNYIAACQELGFVYTAMKRTEPALENLQQALTDVREMTPNNVPMIQMLNNNIAVNYLNEEEPESAIPFLEQAYELAESMAPIARAEPAFNLSKAYRMLRKTQEELRFVREAYPVFENTYGPEHPKTVAAGERLRELEEDRQP